MRSVPRLRFRSAQRTLTRTTPPMPNRLAHETSPYLLQHAHNPVDWYPWGPEALARAKAEQKPIFLSIGYSACHWCHVMEHESFENPDIARLLNEHFITIKVDREERPDLDQIYMSAVQSIAGRGGWPMSVFLTPDLEPFFGGTYWPPTAGCGMPGFDRVLAAVADAWAESPRGDDRAGRPADRARAGSSAASRTSRASSRRRCCVRPARRWSGSFDHATAASAARRSSRIRWTSSCCCGVWRREQRRRRAADGHAHAGQDGQRRHLRPPRRRLPSLLHRRALAGAALREDALRQRPAWPPATSRPARPRQAELRRASCARRSTTCCAR